MVEQVCRSKIGDTPVSTVLIACSNSTPTVESRSGEAYDLKSMTDQIEAAIKTTHSGKPKS